ncbi:MAG: thioredoxin family protein [Armatimonadota bacterium]
MLNARVAVVFVLAGSLLASSVGVATVPAKKPKAGSKTSGPSPSKAAKATNVALPKLIELGAEKCIPCRMMRPILDQLRVEQRGRLEVVFIDVWENPALARQYGIRVIPTQIFLDAKGKEFYRHEGFLPKQQILARFREQGVRLNPTPR